MRPSPTAKFSTYCRWSAANWWRRRAWSGQRRIHLRLARRLKGWPTLRRRSMIKFLRGALRAITNCRYKTGCPLKALIRKNLSNRLQTSSPTSTLFQQSVKVWNSTWSSCSNSALKRRHSLTILSLFSKLFTQRTTIWAFQILGAKRSA